MIALLVAISPFFSVSEIALRVLIDKIMTRGRPKRILMNISTPLKHCGENQSFFHVGFDHREGTRLLADAINRMIGKQASYLMLYGTRGYVSQAREGRVYPADIQPVRFYGEIKTQRRSGRRQTWAAIRPENGNLSRRERYP